MNIGKAAELSGISAKMIRYYEQIGLLDAPERTDSGYRVYGERHVHTLRFVQRARELGFSVEQMQALLALWRDRSRASADVKALALTHVAALEAKAEALAQMAQTLRHLADHCHGNARPDCPIIDALEQGPAGDPCCGAAASQSPVQTLTKLSGSARRAGGSLPDGVPTAMNPRKR